MAFALPSLENPIARAELTSLRREAASQRGWRHRIGRILYLFGVMVSTLPFWIFMSDNSATYVWFSVMLLVIYTIHLQVSLRTLTLASHAISREKHTWDCLILTGQNARQIILGKWWAVVRHVWRHHVLAGILKFGVAVGLAQYLFVLYVPTCLKQLGSGLCHYNIYYNTILPYYNGPALGPFQLLIACIVLLTVYGLLEASLLTALGLLGSLATAQNRAVGVA